MPHSLTHKYIPRVEQREPNLFIEEYYSSTDVRIYIDDIEQTEISYINYALQEQLKPLYGYASRTFDDVAIGNRIVTGALKIPIKNPEAQSQLSDIHKFAQNDPIYRDGSAPGEENTINDYNEEQENLKNAVDWIDDTLSQIQDGNINNGSKPAYLEEDDETFNYRSKLIELGYDLEYGSTTNVLEQQIRKFQEEHGRRGTGLLDTDTKKLIDEAIAEKWEMYDTITLAAGTCIYMSPDTKSDNIVLTKTQTVVIIDRSITGWMQVKLENEQTGWVEIANSN